MNRNQLFALGLVTCSAMACGAPSSPAEGDVSVAASDLTNGVVSPASRPVDGNHVEFNLFPNAKFLPCFAQYPGDSTRPPVIVVDVSRGELNDTLTLTGKNIKPGLQFDMFTVERSALRADASNDPAFKGFGLAWYQSDLHADGGGNLNTTIRTILLDQIFGFDTDVNLAPRNTFHVGFWFNNPEDAVACGFDATKPTPFNGEHRAGPLAMISVPNSSTTFGPLCAKVDWSVSPPRCEP